MTFSWNVSGAVILSMSQDLKIVGAILANNQAATQTTFAMSYGATYDGAYLPVGQRVDPALEVLTASGFSVTVPAGQVILIPLKGTLKKGQAVFIDVPNVGDQAILLAEGSSS